LYHGITADLGSFRRSVLHLYRLQQRSQHKMFEAVILWTIRVHQVVKMRLFCVSDTKDQSIKSASPKSNYQADYFLRQHVASACPDNIAHSSFLSPSTNLVTLTRLTDFPAAFPRQHHSPGVSGHISHIQPRSMSRTALTLRRVAFATLDLALARRLTITEIASHDHCGSQQRNS
jgi:hypothetical protein